VYVAERHRVVRTAARAVFARAAYVTACSDDLRDRARRMGAAQDRTLTIPYGVDVRRFAPDPARRAAVRRAIGVGDAPFVFAAGRLVAKKGFGVLIDAADRLRSAYPALRVLIAGDGDMRTELEARAQRTDGAVRLLGARAQDEVGQLAAAADVVAVPSVHDEAGNVDGLPNVALEALATATPVVASDAGGLRQVIEDGGTGRLVPERDPAALADALRWVLDHPAEAAGLGAAGRARVEACYGWTQVAARLEAVYDAAATGRPLSDTGTEC
jgi:glycosyltransferase involved in cell wall biosynthesis